MPGQRKHKIGIRRKVILIVCLSTLTVMMIGVSLGYFFGFNLLRDTVGDIHRRLSQLLASRITEMFDEEMGRIKSYSDDAIWKDAVIKSNLKYEAMGPEAAKASLNEINEIWAKAKRDSHLLKEYLDNEISAKLRTIANEDKNIAELSVIDRFGALVAASGKTSSFYFADKKWHQEFLAGTAGKIFIGDIEFDEAPHAWIIPILVPIRDSGGNTIGIFKAEVSTGRFFSSLANFRIDNTGYAVLINEKGNIMFQPGASQTNVKFCSDKDYERLLTSKGKYAIIYEPNIQKRKIFVAFSEVASSLLLENKMVWRVLIEQGVEEVFAPLRRITFWVAMSVIFLIVIMVAIGFVFSGILVRPIQKLYGAAIQIMDGNWDYNIDIHTNDEIEQFADAFKEMISSLKGKQEQLLKNKNELEELSKSLEKKVGERTIDLTRAKDKLDNYAKALERALAVKSDFISMTSHELRTPLAAIKEGISIVLEGKTGDVNERQKEFLDIAKRNVDRLNRLINDVLDFHKLEDGKMVLKMEENDINEVARETCNVMLPIAKEKNLKLITDLTEGLPKVKFDKDKITQVLSNLVNNAIKFTEKGGITIATTMGRDSNIIKVSVKDTGIGIKDEDKPLLFQKFTQLERGLERKTGGSGLGLAISQEIINMHKGKIWYESKLGKGTTFYFVLPIKERRI